MWPAYHILQMMLHALHSRCAGCINKAMCYCFGNFIISLDFDFNNFLGFILLSYPVEYRTMNALHVSFSSVSGFDLLVHLHNFKPLRTSMNYYYIHMCVYVFVLDTQAASVCSLIEPKAHNSCVDWLIDGRVIMKEAVGENGKMDGAGIYFALSQCCWARVFLSHLSA